ncbi:calcium-binding protein [Pseudaestuariivita atlantica]|uniref:calcium-binding protein n=1 Tax=Pseudaestuariivita atlantica TaxID=1317121 RepID=UPI00067BA08F|nr:calcium-binding protein [Pseudaestuariivita atlantica]
MPTIVAPTTVTTGTALSAGGVGDTVFVANTIFIISTDESGSGAMDSVAIRAFADNDILVQGTVHGDQWGILMGEEAGGGSVFVSDTGTVSATSIAAIDNTPELGTANTGDFQLTNYGEVTILGNGSAVRIQQGNIGAEGYDGNTNAISNYGAISALDPDGIAINLVNVGISTEIYNGIGAVISTNGERAIYGAVGPNTLGSEPDGNAGILRITNEGEIATNLGNAIQTLNGVTNYITNGGIINGDIRLANGQDEILNSGLINGNVYMGEANDTYDGRGGGQVLGVLDAEGGDDLYFIDVNGQAITDSGGNDTLRANADVANVEGIEQILLRGTGDHSVEGSLSPEEIIGNSGDNLIQGSGGADTLVGASGSDTLEGGEGNDLIRGSTGNDVLAGQDQNDTLLGGIGADTLIGGAGTDNLRGQQGPDVFVFTAITEFGTGATRDIIVDFKRGEDLIDISDVNVDGAFTFLGTGAFTGTGAAEVRFTTNPAGHAIVRFDLDGDGIEDAQLNVRDVGTSLTADDFVL